MRENHAERGVEVHVVIAHLPRSEMHDMQWHGRLGMNPVFAADQRETLMASPKRWHPLRPRDALEEFELQADVRLAPHIARPLRWATHCKAGVRRGLMCA